MHLTLKHIPSSLPLQYLKAFPKQDFVNAKRILGLVLRLQEREGGEEREPLSFIYNISFMSSTVHPPISLTSDTNTDLHKVTAKAWLCQSWKVSLTEGGMEMQVQKSQK